MNEDFVLFFEGRTNVAGTLIDNVSNHAALDAAF